MLAILLCEISPRAASAALVGPLQPGQLCQAAIADATRAFAIPVGLLDAIGRVESGRQSPVTGNYLPWPWTVDADGRGYFYSTKEQAIAAVEGFQASGVRSIDVGCMQINLLDHPTAFASLGEAFDPGSNAAYAARLLRRLHMRTESWPEAAAFYHSATPEFALPYERLVMAAWPMAPRGSGGTLPAVFDGTQRVTPRRRLAASGPFVGRAGAFMLRDRPLGAPPLRPLVFGPRTLSGRTLDSYRRSPILIASGSGRGVRGGPIP